MINSKSPVTGPVLGIESSCDETGVAVYQAGRGLLAHRLYSQIKLHALYGGVVPELATCASWYPCCARPWTRVA